MTRPTMAQKRFAAEQAIDRLLGADGIRWAGRAKYAGETVPSRYHIVLKIETMPNHQYDWQIERYRQEVAKGRRWPYISAEPQTTYTTATLACGIENMGVGPYQDIVELGEPGAEPLTDAPKCKACLRIVAKGQGR